MYIPPYSPFLNPTEELFSKLKNGVQQNPLTQQDNLIDRITQSGERLTFRIGDTVFFDMFKT